MANKLYEYTPPEKGNFQILEEGHGEKKKLFMVGTFIQSEVRNQNQRVYPMSEISSAVDTVTEKISSGQSVLGELDHPEELTINLDRVSHLITEMWMNGNDGCGKLKIIDTVPMGQIAKGLIESGVKLGVSSRGSGNVNHDGTVSDYEIITVDIVAQPSAPDAYPKSIYESLYNMRGGSVVHDVATEAAHGDPRAKIHLQKDVIRFIRDLKV